MHDEKGKLNMYQCILASGSPRRKEILEQCGIPFAVVKSDVEEVITKTEPGEVVQELSLLKAQDVADKVKKEKCVIIGADTIVAHGSKILGKPADEEDAFQMIQSIQGKAHSVYTGVALIIKNGKEQTKLTFFEETKVEIESMTDEEIKEYVKGGEPMDKAGSYAIQGEFAIYVKGIEGDYYNVVGLPIARIRKELKKVQIDLKKDCKR